jgi:hypothetical protein
MAKLGREIKRIISADAESFSVKVEYENGELICVPLRHVFEKPKGLAAEVLRGGMFPMCFVESGALAWPNGLELCPDALLMWAEEKMPKPSKRQRA